MYAVDPAWYTAHDAPGKQVTVLVELLGLGRTLTNAATPAAPTAEPLLRSVLAGSVGEVTNTLDPWTGLAQIAQVQVQVSNTTGFARTLPATFRKSAVRIRLGIGTLTTLADFLPVFTGHVEQVTATGPVCTITLVPGAFAWHRDLSVLLGDYFFTGTDDTQTNQAIPLLVGRNVAVEVVPITAVVSGALAEAVSAADTALRLRQFSARFAPTGTVILGDDAETVTYTRREIVATAGGDVLVLSGLGRPSPVAHAVGASVALALETWQYLIGFQCSVLAVYRDGRLLSPGAYTVEEIPIPGTLPATVLSFSTSQAGMVLTVDVEGSNIAPTVSPLTNGGFESGDLTGWTLTGATATVTAAETPDGSQYKCQVTGGSATMGFVTQTFAVTPQRGYVLSAWARPQTARVSLATVNEDFQTGDLTGWTSTLQTSHPELDIALTFGANAPYLMGIPQGAILRPTPESTAWGLGLETMTEYQATFAQSCTIEAGLAQRYFCNVKPLSFLEIVTLGTAEPYIGMSGNVRVRVVAEPSGTVLVDVQHYLQRTDTLTLQGVFTTGATQVRLEILLTTQGFLRVPAPLTLLTAYVIREDNLSRVSGYLAVGPPDAPADALWSSRAVHHGAEGQWAPFVLPFVPSSTPAQLTVAAAYDSPTLPAALWVDAFRLEEEGRHPVDVLRWLIATFLPGLAINAASFQAAYLARAAWRCGGQWRDPGDSRALLTHLADQFELRYFENGTGEACLVPIATQPETGTMAATLTPQTARGVTPTGEPPTQLATDLYVYYNPRRGTGGQDPADYGAVVYATPEATTGDQRWQVACYQVETVYGIRQTVRYFAEAIQDQVTAHLKLAALVARYTTLGTRVTCTDLVLRDAPLEIGDVLAVQHPVLGELPQVGEVLGVSVDLSTPALTVTARLTEVWGTEERYDAFTVLLTGGTEEGYPDVVVTLDEGTEEGYNT